MIAPRWKILAALLTLAGSRTSWAAEEAGSRDQRSAAERSGSQVADKVGATIDISQLSKQPKLTKPAKVTYPAKAIGKVEEAVEVTLAIDLDEKGEVAGVAVMDPKPNVPADLGFEDAALSAAYDLRFEPAEAAGKPIPIQIIYKFKFPPPPPPAPVVPAPSATETATATATTAVEKPKPQPVRNLEGVLLERGTRAPMSGITVTVYRDVDGKNEGFESTTDADGHFEFFDLEPATWKILVETPSYYPFRTTEEIRVGEAVHAKYYVERGSYNPFDKVVTGKRERKEVSRTVVENVVIEKAPGAAGDPLAVIQNLAGVARPPAFSGYIITRGSNPADTQIFVDGATVPLIYHFGGLRTVLPVGMVQNLEFYPGNFSPYYGRAQGGIIDVESKKLKPTKLGGYFDVNLYDSGVYVETPIGSKAAIAIAARRSYVDYLLNAAIPSNAPVADLQLPRYYDYQLLANYRPTPAHDFRLFAFASDDLFKMVIKNVSRASTDITSNELLDQTTFYRATAVYRYVPGGNYSNTLRVSQGRDKMNVAFLSFFKEELTLDTTHVRDTFRYEWSKKLALTTGLDVLYYRVPYGVVQAVMPPQEGQEMSEISWTDQRYRDFSNTAWFLPAAFAELELRLGRLLVLPGARFDYFSELSQAVVAPRLTARYELNDRVTLKGGAGVFYQNPTVDQSDSVFGNPDLKAQRALHYSLGAEWRPLQNITLDLTGFYKSMSSQVSATTAVRPDGKPMNYDSTGAGRAYGLEFVARHELTSKFTGWIAYTLSRSERRDSGQTDYRLFQYDQTHILTALGTYQLPRNWSIGGRLRYVTGNPNTPVSNSVFNSTNGRYTPIYGAKYSTRVPAFAQLDIRVDKRWIFNAWTLTAYLDIQNVSNRANPEEIQYNYDYTKSQASQGLPIYPIFGLKGEF
jgi:TonB family protein